MDQPPLMKYVLDGKYIEAESVGKAILSLNKEYKSYIKNRFGNRGTYKDAKLLIKGVQDGSQEYHFIETLVYMGMMSLSNYNTMADFIIHIKALIEHYKGIVKTKPQIGKESMENVMNIIEPILNDNSNDIKISLEGANITIEKPTININYSEGNIIYNNAQRDINNISSPSYSASKSVEIYFTQIAKSDSGSKALVPSVSNKTLPIKFSDDNVKSTVIDLKNKNPLLNGFKAEIEVEEVQGKTKSYIVKQIKGLIDPEPDLFTDV